MSSLKVCLDLFLFNPLEAMVLISLLNYFIGIKLKPVDYIKHAYILGTINLAVQYFPKLFDNKILVLVLNVLIVIVIGFIIKLYYNKILKINNIKIRDILKVLAIYMITLMGIVGGINNYIFINTYVNGQPINIKYDLLYTFIFRTLQFSGIYLLYFYKKRRNNKNVKKNK